MNTAPCHACKSPFPLLDARWCSCIAKEPTLVCPACGQCFCRAPNSYKQAFWRDAPPELWQRKLAARRSLQGWTNQAPHEVARPLVLVVDDEPNSRALLVARILANGYGVVVAADGAEGLDLARTYRPDLILTDAFMPKLDGREMARRIRSEPGGSTSHIVVMTSLYTGAPQKHEALKRFGVDDYLEKPLAFEAVDELLRRVLA